jgi:hypothetical protein
MGQRYKRFNFRIKKVQKQKASKNKVCKYDNKDIDHKNGNLLNINPENLQIMFRK